MLRGEPIWHTSSTGPMSMPELERGGGHQRLQVAGPQARLDPVAAVLRQAAVVGGDDVVAQPLAELVGEPLGQAAGVDEHERGAVLARPARRCGRARRPSARPRRPPRARRRAARARGRGRAGGRRRRSAGQRPVADEQPADRLDRALRGRQADPRPGAASHSASSRSRREREVRAALVARDGVDLVDDDRLDRAQRVAAAARW